MKKTILLLIASILLSAPLCRAVGVDWGKLPSTTIINAIDEFGEHCADVNGRISGPVIVNYAEASTNVIVNLNTDLMPWINEKPEIKNSELLLIGFIAGNMKPQLEKKITKDHSVDGILYMCRVYKALRKKKLIEEIEELESWRRLKRKEVEALVRESQSKSKKKF